MDAISVVASGLLSSPPPPSEIITPMSHAGTLVATDGTNVMAMNNSTSGNITVGPLSDFSQIDNTWTKPFTAASSLQVLNYGAGVFMAVDWNGKSYWSDDLGENWTVGTGHDPAFNTAQAGWYSDELAVFMHNNHQPTYSIDGKVKLDALSQPQSIQSDGGYNQLDFKGTTFNYTLNSQRFIWYNTGSDFTLGWAQATREVTKSTQGIATDGLVVASVSGDTVASFVRSSTDGFTFTADIATSGLTVTRPRHIMYHQGEWIIINRDGACWTSDDLITWTAQGDTYLTGSSSGSSNAEWHSMENQNIIRWGAGGGQSRENFAIFFLNQIYQSTVDAPSVTAYDVEVLADAPLGYWKLDETAADLTSMVDSSGNGYDGTFTANHNREQTPLINTGTSIEMLANAGDGVNINGAIAALQLTGDVTIEAWVNINAFSGNMYIVNCSSIVSRPEQASDNYLWSLSLDSTGFMRSFWEFGGGTNQTTLSTHAITTGTVHHLVIVRDATALTCTFYDNGVEYDTVGYASNSSGGGDSIVQIGKRLGGGELDGFIDEVAVYGTKLSATRIAAHYAAGTS